MITVSVIGSGNVAQHLIKVFSKTTGIELIQAFARQPESLLPILPSEKITNDYQTLQKADVYIIAVTDNAIAEVSEQLPFENQLVVHTSGTSDITILNDKNRKGVFYPLQTFSKNKAVDFSAVPLCLETEHEADFTTLELLGNAISEKVYSISSEQRRSLHVAAVFVCNFVNHLYQIGDEIHLNSGPFCDHNAVVKDITKTHYVLILESLGYVLKVKHK